MKKFLIGVLLIPALVHADAWRVEDPTVPSSEDPTVEMARLQGVVIEKDGVFQRLTVQAPDGRVEEFPVNPTAVITERGQVVPFADLRIGDRVVVNYQPSPGRVNRIEKL